MNITPIYRENISLECIGDRIFIKGSVESKTPSEFMTQFFDEIHNQAIKEKIKELYVDITKLHFLNSNGIKELAKWLIKIINLDEKEKYKVIFICDKNIVWQETSINILAFLNKNLIFSEFIN